MHESSLYLCRKNAEKRISLGGSDFSRREGPRFFLLPALSGLQSKKARLIPEIMAAAKPFFAYANATAAGVLLKHLFVLPCTGREIDRDEQ